MAADGAPDKQDMILAFGYETAREIVYSDGSVHSSELLDVTQRFPKALLEERGLITNGAPTPRFGLAYNLAVAKLRSMMSDAEKLEMAQALFEICSADESVDPEEIKIILRAMGILGVTKAELAEYLRIRIKTVPPPA